MSVYYKYNTSTFTALTEDIGGSYENKRVGWRWSSPRVEMTLITHLSTDDYVFCYCICSGLDSNVGYNSENN